MTKISRYMVRGAIAPVCLTDHGLYVLHSDYVADVNARLDAAAKIVDDSNHIDYAPNNGPAARIRAMKVLP